MMLNQALALRRAACQRKEPAHAGGLAVICTCRYSRSVAELGAWARAAVVLSAGLAQLRDGAGVSLERRMLEAARPHGLRVLGPNCLGLGVPGIGLNATFANVDALPGDLAFVSQSGAVCTVALDWACGSQIGFSHFVSLGDSLDVDAADLLDWLGADPGTRAILLYLESVGRARKFLSAARAAARNKPVIAIKAGRVAEGARAAMSHTGALAGVDEPATPHARRHRARRPHRRALRRRDTRLLGLLRWAIAAILATAAAWACWRRIGSSPGGRWSARRNHASGARRRAAGKLVARESRRHRRRRPRRAVWRCTGRAARRPGHRRRVRAARADRTRAGRRRRTRRRGGAGRASA
jgi:hypothetical protein